MGGRVSPEMLKARELIKQGATAYRAAKETGLTTGAITRSPWYKEYKLKQQQEDVNNA